MNAIVYLANARLPTEKAHGYQICKMCEAFSCLGLDVRLYHPYRRHKSDVLQKADVHTYYNVKPSFTVHRLANADFFVLEPFLPRRALQAFFFLQGFIWALHAVRQTKKLHDALYYTRDSSIAFWLTRTGLPTVFEVHTIPQGFQRRVFACVAQRPSLLRTIAITSFIKERLVDLGFSPEKIQVEPDCADPALFEDIPDTIRCKQRASVPADDFVIGYIGRFQTMEMEKGIFELIQAVHLLRSTPSGSSFCLLCVGGPMKAVTKYLAHAQKLGMPEHALRFVDRVPAAEVPLWIRACDVVTIPWPWTEFSAYYTSPMKLFEYMASGVPIVASDLPAIREILQHNRNALLTEPGNPRSLADALYHLAGKPATRKTLSANALRDVQRYNWHSRVRSILKSVSG